MIKAVLFDFGQTLVDSSAGFKLAEKTAQEKIFHDLGVSQRDGFMSHYRRIRKEHHGSSSFSRPAMWNELYYYYCAVSDTAKLLEWETEYWETVKANSVPFPETMAVLQELSKSYKLGLISNTQGQKSSGAHRLELFPRIEHYFSAIIISGEGDIPPKPHCQPFRLCLSQLGVKPEEVVHVGDDWRIDICGAQGVGIHPVWLKHYSVKLNWPQVETHVPVIDSLDKLPDIVRRIN